MSVRLKKSEELLAFISKKIGLDLSYLLRTGNWVTIRFFFLAVGGFLTSFFFARFGTKELLGQYQLILSFVSFVSFFSFLGLNAAALEAVVRGREAGVLRAAKLIFRCSLIGVPIIAGYGLYRVYGGDTLIGGTFLFTAIVFPFFYSLNTWNVFYEGKSQFKESSRRLILLSFFLTTFLIGGIFLSANVFVLIAGYFVINIIFQAFFFKEILKKVSDRSRDSIDTKFGVWVSFQKYAFALSTTLPPLALSFLFGVEALAVYFITYYVIGTLASFLSTISTVYTPLLFKLQKLNHKNIILQSGLVGIATWLTFLIFLRFFFIPIYGDSYRHSQNLAYALSLLLLMIPLRVYLVNYFTTQKKNGLLIAIFSFANILGLIFLLLLREKGFSTSMVTYLYVLEVVTFFPLLYLYLVHAFKKDRLNFS